ncbi:MAG: viologen exporter family transport system permease protein, partial [Clostridiales bacterium]|nr:viologen exporter family transport system permease protein [Clostridiales bacterium]
ASFAMTAVGQFLVSFNAFLGVMFLFARFSKVEGFTYSEVLLCFSISLLAFSLAEMIARGFDTFSFQIRTGSFDRVLVRPQSEILQVLGSKFELTRVGRMLQALIMFVYGILHSHVQWTILKVVCVGLMLLGGMALFSGIFMIYAAFCFFTIEGLEFMNILTHGAREYGTYPLSIYGKRILQITTFFIPYALVQYYPLLYLLGRRTSWFYAYLPLLAFFFLLPCFAFWRFGVRHYKSCGS